MLHPWLFYIRTALWDKHTLIIQERQPTPGNSPFPPSTIFAMSRMRISQTLNSSTPQHTLQNHPHSLPRVRSFSPRYLKFIIAYPCSFWRPLPLQFGKAFLRKLHNGFTKTLGCPKVVRFWVCVSVHFELSNWRWGIQLNSIPIQSVISQAE